MVIFKFPIKIDIVSDLHIDQWSKKYNILYPCGNVKEYPFKFRETDARYLIVAGDISDNLDLSIKYLNDISVYYDKILFVDGNHEHVNKYPDLYSKLYIKTLINNKKIIFLPISPFKIDSTIILGCSGWWDYMSGNKHFINENKNYFENWIPSLNDKDGKKFIDNCIMKSKQEYTILEKYIIKYSKDFFIKNIIIVTHTIPLKRFCCNKRIATELNSSFEKLLEYKKISHWIFGHTHENFNETYKGVHFVCNSRGRPADKNRINYSMKQMVI